MYDILQCILVSNNEMALWMNKKIIKHRRGKDSVLVKHSHDADPSVHTGRVGLNNICCFIRSTTEVILTTVINFVREFFFVISYSKHLTFFA